MQVLIGISDTGEIRHTEMISVTRPLQLSSLARNRSALFARVEVWEESVCVFRYPPLVRNDPRPWLHGEDTREVQQDVAA